MLIFVQSLIADRAKLRTSHDDFEVTRRRIATARDKYQSLLVEAETKMKRLEFTKQENRRTIGALQSQVEDDLDAEKECKLLHEERMAEQITSLKAGQRREMGAMRSQLADLQEAYDRERTAKGMVEEALGEVRVIFFSYSREFNHYHHFIVILYIFTNTNNYYYNSHVNTGTSRARCATAADARSSEHAGRAGAGACPAQGSTAAREGGARKGAG